MLPNKKSGQQAQQGSRKSNQRKTCKTKRKYLPLSFSRSTAKKEPGSVAPSTLPQGGLYKFPPSQKDETSRMAVLSDFGLLFEFNL
ncbi:MAG: hypothetical protein MR516_05500 [Bacteroidales bacterium]|nr:hypothetical protein [Bacteroidales bacterium]